MAKYQVSHIRFSYWSWRNYYITSNYTDQYFKCPFHSGQDGCIYCDHVWRDIRDDKVRTIVYTCLVGNAAKDILKEAGIQIGQKLTTNAIRCISKDIIVKINKAVGFRLLTKTGATGVINMSKFVPVVGGIVGGSLDAITTNIVGNYARDTFLSLIDNDL